ncbi:MAG: anthranilate phosphoribosyltransferase [Alphaproteobacteria bacterium]|nr:anthranilate phosphoribosyltransferase [Alphaproteobacteria bacterium]
MLVEVLERVASGAHLTPDEMAAAVASMLDPACQPAQIAALLTAIRVKGETVGELVGAARALRANAVRLPLRQRPDLCTAGTGGDGKGTINLSTVAALVAAAAGVSVAKHGNRSVSSRCGSADVLEALGIPTNLDAATAAQTIDRTGFAFLFAPLYHPATKAVAGVRRSLGIRTLFNLLGPLTNPAEVRAQLVGVYHPEKLQPMAQALAALGVERALVVSADIGLDEIAPQGITRAMLVDRGTLTKMDLAPANFGLPETPLSAIQGGDAHTNAAIVQDLLEGRDHPARPAALMNAAAALFAAGRVTDLPSGVALATATIDSGRAARLLTDLAAPARAAA